MIVDVYKDYLLIDIVKFDLYKHKFESLKKKIQFNSIKKRIQVKNFLLKKAVKKKIIF